MNRFEILKQQYKDKLLNTKQTTREAFKILLKEFGSHNLVLIGLRQVGKTTLAEQLIREFVKSLKKKMPSNEVMSVAPVDNDFYYLNLKGMPNLDQQALTKYISEQRFKAVLIDEIQIIDDWTNFAQVIIDLNPSTKFIFTGSNASSLSKETMVNRTKVFYINPLSFNEFKMFWHIDDIGIYLKYGSYPKFEKYGSPEIQYHEIADEQIIDKIITLDSKNEVTQSKFKSLMKGISNYIGNELKIAQLETHQISRPTITSYLALMEASTLVKRIWKNNDKSDKRIGKAYFTDKSMMYRFNDYNELDGNQIGSLIENVVFNYLDSKFFRFNDLNNQIEYFIGDNRKEIDFVIDSQKLLIEVKFQSNIDLEELSNTLNETLARKNQDYRKIVITKNHEGNSNGWEFIKLEKLLTGGYDGL